MSIIRGNAVIFTQGGPTAVINASWVGVVEGLLNAPEVTGVWGSLHGIDGILAEDFVDLKAQTIGTIQAIARTPASQLYSTRHKPTAEENMKIFDIFRKYNIRYVFGIGGNDTSETLDIINRAAREVEYELRMLHVAKTVDNDLMENDHTPGYGSAARYVANLFRGIDLDNASFGGMFLGVCMGRHAGWLTAASALGRVSPDAGPHLIYLPERPFDLEKFGADALAVYRKYRRCVIAVSEGVQDIPGKDGKPILQTMSDGNLEVDSHGNVQLSGSGALADALIGHLKTYFKTNGIDKLRARGDTLGYAQRSFPDQSPVDREEAISLGRFAAQCGLSGNVDGSVAIRRISTNPYRVENRLLPLETVAGKTRHVDDEFINSEGNNVTDKFIEWGTPLIGELGIYGLLDMSKVIKPQ